ncbi:putative polyketide synthase [Rostrohypoxylon terebratum]|nr:putative polyketide synthase [Rostrohypoxylon terebratum]
MAKIQFRQEPIAVVGFACRLPGGNYSPRKLWDFLERGEVASNKVPKSRFNIDGHYDGSHKPGTMRPSGGMFIGDVDLAKFDASFFEIGGTEAIAMDPNQRQMLEIVVEGLENAGIPLEKLDGKSVACFVGSYASDYGDMQNRDAEDRPANFPIGVGRSIMANRLSYYLNIKGPSIAIDTACSGSLVGLDLACRSIQSGEVDAAIVAASNFYLNPDHVMDIGNFGQAHSPSGLCHTFDIDADGYVKAEAVSCLIVKRLSAAIRDRDPIRAIVRGTASNSNGRTGGIASPSSEAQADAIRAAYANAGITNLNETAYLECHGTGTQAGDPTEIKGIGSVFAATRSVETPLLIGSIKSNIGHSEPAAGNSGLIKVILSMEQGVIPGTPLFIKPSPKIDFERFKVKASRTAIPWPDSGLPLRRASINSFGFGGSNAHAILELPDSDARRFYISSYRPEDDEDDFEDIGLSNRPQLLVISANDSYSLAKNIEALSNHLINLRTKVNLEDLAYTLSERRTRLWHRAFLSTRSSDINDHQFTIGKNSGMPTKIALVFTGQGAQWPQMGKELLELFPWTRSILEELDEVLQSGIDPPEWSLVSELTESRTSDHIRQPEFSQPLVTALQLCILAVLESWGLGTSISSTVGHSSGEIAAAYAAGLLDRAGAIKAAYYRGRAAVNCKGKTEENVGMLAVNLSREAITPYMENYTDVWIACYNSPSSLTISGKRPALEALAEEIKAAGHFARLLQVDLAYHSELMSAIGDEYSNLLATDSEFHLVADYSKATMFSSVIGTKKETSADALYWKTNMVSPVQFAEALKELVTKDSPSLIIEVGPSGALAGPVSQVLKGMSGGNSTILYCSSWSRGSNASKSLFDVAGHLFMTGAPIDMSRVNEYNIDAVRTTVDLPNYSWNHTISYWHENAASKDWRNKKFITHDLLGSKIPGVSWESPTWRQHLRLDDVPWLRDHKMGPDILIPGAGLAAMALEAMYQKHCALNPDDSVTSPNELAYRFRNVKFDRAVVVEEEKPTTMLLTLSSVPGSKNWHEFRIRTTAADVVYEYCSGLIRVQDPVGDDGALKGEELRPLKHPQSTKLWYKALQEIGVGFGPTFQKIKSIESISGSRHCRSIVSMEPPASKWEPQSYYPVHPAVLDGCLQSATPANAAGERNLIKDTMIPALVDDMIINKMPKTMTEGLSVAESIYTGRGRKDVAKSWIANIAIHDPQTGALVIRVRGLNFVRLDVDEKPDPHVLQTVTWQPDISLLTQDQLVYLSPSDTASTKLDTVIDLVAQKTPSLSVLEINLDDKDTSTLWFRGGDVSARAAYTRYDFLSLNANAIVSVQAENESRRNTEFHLMVPNNKTSGLTVNESTYGLVIIKAPKKSDISVEEVIRNLKPLLKPDTFTLLVPVEDTIMSRDLPSTETLSTPSEESSDLNSDSLPDDTAPITRRSSFLEVKDMGRLWSMKLPSYLSVGNENFGSIMEIPGRLPSSPAYLCSNMVPKKINQPGRLTIARFHELAPFVNHALQATLQESGWKLQTTSIERLAVESEPDSVTMVIDELFNPVMTNISESQWEALKQVIGTGRPLLWVTKGSQTAQATDPDNAMVHGLFRVVRREDPQARLVTLDVQSATSPATAWAIDQVLKKIRDGTDGEAEYAEREGIILQQRVRPDVALNDFKTAASGKGLNPVMMSLHENEAQVRIQAEKIGTLQSLTWCETAVGEAPMERGMVEIEVMAVGVNFKDVATTMGIVPENEYTIGYECAGYIKRIAPGLETHLKVGDRVAATGSGTYVNRVQCPHERVQVIPDSMSFEDAASIPLVYLTAIYSLYYLGNLRQGQSVLIHSAAGGVGIAAIQLAQYKKCDIFVTVGTDDKRKFLADHFHIPHNRIFGSRDTKFAEDIWRETDGRGVYVILNSLIGELLDESWRLVADGGTMVEIGKRDIVDRNTLSMEPFDRNCSFRAVDLSYTKEISDALIGTLMVEIFDLVKGGHIGPIHPITTYGFDEVVLALSHIRRGQHIGKIVVSSGEKDVLLPIRPAIRQLQLDPKAEYLIIGGLKGLCGSIAVHMASHGARHIIVMNRGGLQDDASARIIENCAGHGCKVISAKGDVGDIDFVKRVFKEARPRRIAGVIQGAMVLRDKPYEMTSHDDYHTAIYAKVKGTWNLHNASREQKQPLDFFTMLSSISGVVGNKGQANYAAANAFLDAFASYRIANGLRANTVDLGVIEDVGYVAEQDNDLVARFDKYQWTPINEGMLRKIVSFSIFQQHHVPINASSGAQMITGLSYPLAADKSDLAEEPRFSYLFSDHGDSGGCTGDDSEGSSDQFTQAIKAFGVMHASGADAVALSKAALGLLQTQIAKVLRLESEMEPGKSLKTYGLDSLSAVEIRGWIRQKLRSEVSALDITNAGSLVALSEKLVSKLSVAEGVK